jgi:hypothetical protein
MERLVGLVVTVVVLLPTVVVEIVPAASRCSIPESESVMIPTAPTLRSMRPSTFSRPVGGVDGVVLCPIAWGGVRLRRHSRRTGTSGPAWKVTDRRNGFGI